MIFGILNSSTSFAGPSTRPDWSHSKSYSVKLSSSTVKYVVPVKFSGDFDVMEPTNNNIYDDNLYRQWTSFTVSSMYWDYKSSMILWTEMYGTLKMHVMVQKNPDSFKVRNMDELQKAITDNLRKIYDIPPGQYRDNSGFTIPQDFENISINNIEWTKFLIVGGTSSADMIAYATPLSADHILEVYFTIMEAKPRNDKNWYNICLNDIEKIMDSFKLTHPRR